MGKINWYEGSKNKMNNAILERQQKDKENLIEQFKKTPIIQLACEKAGIGRATYYRWRREDSEFARYCDDALRESVGLMNDMAESQLLSAIKEKNMTAIIFWLKHRHKGYSTKIELSGDITQRNITLTEEQKNLIKTALQVASEKEEII